ncbi:MAG: hypothetical protein ACT452_20765 [Microthrixaceae bacterium]
MSREFREQHISQLIEQLNTRPYFAVDRGHLILDQLDRPRLECAIRSALLPP